MARKAQAPDKQDLNLPCCAVMRPKGVEMTCETNEHEFIFRIESVKWPYPDKLSVTIPVATKNLKGAEGKLEIVRLNHGRTEEILIKGGDARAVRHAGDLLEDLFLSATATHRVEFVLVERTSPTSTHYLVHLSRPQRDGRSLGTPVNERKMATLMHVFEVKTPKELEGKGFNTPLKDPFEALSLFAIHADYPAYAPPASQVLVHGLSGWITTGTVNDEWVRSVRGKLSESDRLKQDWKKKMRGEKTEEEALKEQWLAKMRGEEAGGEKENTKRHPLPQPLAAVDRRTSTEFLRLFGSSNTARMDSLIFLLHNAGIELEACEKQAPGYRLRVLASKDKPHRYLVWNEWDIRILSESQAKEELFGVRGSRVKAKEAKEVKDMKEKKEKRSSGKKIDVKDGKHKAKKSGASGSHKKD